MKWYEGLPLLRFLEEVHIASDRNLIDSRFPVQCVIRPMSSSGLDYRGYAGPVSGGVVKPGDGVFVRPSGFTSTIDRKSVVMGTSVSVRLDLGGRILITQNNHSGVRTQLSVVRDVQETYTQTRNK